MANQKKPWTRSDPSYITVRKQIVCHRTETLPAHLHFDARGRLQRSEKEEEIIREFVEAFRADQNRFPREIILKHLRYQQLEEHKRKMEEEDGEEKEPYVPTEAEIGRRVIAFPGDDRLRGQTMAQILERLRKEQMDKIDPRLLIGEAAKEGVKQYKEKRVSGAYEATGFQDAMKNPEK